VLIETGEAIQLGVDEPVLAVAEEPKQPGTWMGRRLLWLEGKPAFELSLWCGTCPFLFKRMDGANGTLSIDDLTVALDAGTTGIDVGIVQAFGSLLPRGQYLPLLIELRPTLTYPSTADDYFSHEQVATWGVDSFWGLPEYPQTPYYRTFQTRVSADAHLYEFVVPMVPPRWNDPDRVSEHRKRLAAGSLATAVAISTLDVCQPADREPDVGDYYQHWGLTHFLLDGHHKMQAASEAGVAVRLLSLLSVDASLASEVDIRRVVKVRSRASVARAAH
jgi:hypothetical protein